MACGVNRKIHHRRYCRHPFVVEYASEFRYRNPVVTCTDVVIAISQSGEAADTLAADYSCARTRAFVFAICNVVGPNLARMSDLGIYTHAGPEIGVASTKAFSSWVLGLLMLGLELGRLRGVISNDQYAAYVGELVTLSIKIKETLTVLTH